MDMLDKRMSHILWLQGLGWDDTRCHHATQNSAQWKTYVLFISGIFFFLNIFGLRLTAGN